MGLKICVGLVIGSHVIVDCNGLSWIVMDCRGGGGRGRGGDGGGTRGFARPRLLASGVA